MTIAAEILSYIRNPDPAAFQRLALAVFAWQFAHIKPYREFVSSSGISPATVRTVAEIPPVSTAAFKYAVLGSGTPQRVFLTSGTTRGREERGRHPIADLSLYRASALAHLERMLFPDGCRPWMLALHPAAEGMPESSLSQMISWCIEAFGGTRSLCGATPLRVDAAAAADFLREAEACAAPVCILTTTAALAALFDHLKENRLRFQLAAGSRLMDTGGAKGQANPLTPEEVLGLADKYLAIPPRWVINEYGMTELCSQLYDATEANTASADGGVERVKVAPPWLKVFARDPKSLLPLPPGEIGLLSFFDLANAGSVSALLSEDAGVVNADGTVRMLGRFLDADPRGCALRIEQFRTVASHSPVHPDPIPGQRGGIGKAAGRTAVGRIESAAMRLREAAGRPPAPTRIAEVLSEACRRWRDPAFSGRAAALGAIAAVAQSLPLLDASIDALLAGFTAEGIAALAGRVGTRPNLIGFVMPGNVAGAGLHELVQALLAGCSAIVKPSSSEPFFFPQFHRTLHSIDEEVAARMEVMVWDRSDGESTHAMALVCDRIAAFGDDETIAALSAIAPAKLIGFGSRLSGAVVAREALAADVAKTTAAALARDVSLYDQRGCLSLHHVMVEAPDAQARDFAALLASELDAAAAAMPPDPAPPMTELAGARSLRENARWRRLGGAPVELWEGEGLSWTVIFDPQSPFQPSPLRRTVRVSAFDDVSELAGRLRPVAGMLEACALADPGHRLDEIHPVLRDAGVSYLCAPGWLQSPPPSWAHGGGRFLRLMEQGDG
jgi:hypothetical protein